MFFSHHQLNELPERYRVNLINALSGFKSANLVATSSKSGELNIALFSSVFHVGANPALMGMLSRPHSVPRHTLENILETGDYTINSVSEDMLAQAHLCSARSDRSESEFSLSHLDAHIIKGFSAPAIAQSPLQIGLRLKETIPIQTNDTVLIIGEVQHIFVPDEALHSDGFIDHGVMRSLTISGLDAYHSTTSLGRLPYAKKSQTLGEILGNMKK